jgi:hypothetical protein
VSGRLVQQALLPSCLQAALVLSTSIALINESTCFHVARIIEKSENADRFSESANDRKKSGSLTEFRFHLRPARESSPTIGLRFVGLRIRVGRLHRFHNEVVPFALEIRLRVSGTCGRRIERLSRSICPYSDPARLNTTTFSFGSFVIPGGGVY